MRRAVRRVVVTVVGVDAVIVSTPNRVHHPIVMAAIGAGLHVMCEKPFATQANHARELVRLVEERELPDRVLELENEPFWPTGFRLGEDHPCSPGDIRQDEDHPAYDSLLAVHTELGDLDVHGSRRRAAWTHPKMAPITAPRPM